MTSRCNIVFSKDSCKEARKLFDKAIGMTLNKIPGIPEHAS